MQLALRFEFMLFSFVFSLFVFNLSGSFRRHVEAALWLFSAIISILLLHY